MGLIVIIIIAFAINPILGFIVLIATLLSSNEPKDYQ